VDERPGGRVDPVAVEVEDGVPLRHDEHLLVRAGVVLVVLVDDPVTRGTGRPGRDAERPDTEVEPDRPEGSLSVDQFVDLI
jgi:hypothetical protein